MKNSISKIKIAAVVLVLALTFTVVLAEPGGADDPIISKSYIDNVLMPQIKDYIESRLKGVVPDNGNQSTGETAAETFTVVSMSKGQKMTCDAGCELILRMGQAEIFATEKGGLADTTAGYDLANKTNMPSNHLLIVPVGDGRGIIAQNDVLVMVKGGYTLGM